MKHRKVCPLCRRKVEELVTNLLAETEGINLALIRAQYPRWQEEKGLCLQCLEYYRAWERYQWIDITPLLPLYFSYFSPSAPLLDKTAERTLKMLVHVYSLPVVEMAMVEALFRDRASLRTVLKILRQWRQQGAVDISYSPFFYERVKREWVDDEEE